MNLLSCEAHGRTLEASISEYEDDKNANVFDQLNNNSSLPWSRVLGCVYPRQNVMNYILF
jgi:hypothetical protein